jgi:outer membrane protein assembly factor BamE (lipoprotein component of BamABCDE complex)
MSWSIISGRETMKRLIRLAILLGLVVIVSGCGIARQVKSHEAHKRLMQLQVGMDREAALSLMGQPYTREAYGDEEFLIYETNHWANDERRRFTPVLIKNEKVAGWGQKYYTDTSEQRNRAGTGVKPR